MTTGISESISSFVVMQMLLYFSTFDFVATMVLFIGTNKSQTFIASPKNPTRFPLISKMILVAPCFFKSNKAALVSDEAFPVIFDKTTQPMMSSNHL